MIRVIAVFIILTATVQAREFHYLARSPKALLMGDAFTAIADDEYTLFYNPASLSKHKGLSVFFINPDVSATNVLGETDKFENFPSRDPVAIADRVIGIPLHLHAAAIPGLKLESFGINLFANVTANAELRNRTHPALDVDYRYDRGFIFGYSFSLGKGFKARKPSRKKQNSKKSNVSGSTTSFGVSVKNMNRQGIYDSYDLFGQELLNIIAEGKTDDYHDIRNSLGYSKGSAWGVDTGFEFAWTSKISQFSTGLSVMDVGGTKYKRESGVGAIPDQEMAINWGIAWRQDFWIIDYALTFDVHPINSAVDYRRKIHFGMEFGIPLISAMFGWSGGYISYGAQFEFWPLKVIGGFYGTEIGGGYRQEEGKRALIYVSILHFSFDA
ncbi:MAG: hypothetical protein HQK50_17415 [Oligoflexia bacterium]|nr:hypothetical protein [Oligoflexia bacterium]MBF0367358.1 hypothetical protein [Oligoflexia bacterium]